MPKLKSHKGLRKRIRITRRGKVIAHRPGRSHLMSSKSSKRKRFLRRTSVLPSAMARMIKRAVIV